MGPQIVLLLALIPAARATWLGGGALIQSILDQGPLKIPYWLESALPVRGSWLRLLVWLPVVIPMILSLFLAVLCMCAFLLAGFLSLFFRAWF